MNGRRVEIATGGGNECTVVFEAGLGAGLPAWTPFAAKLDPSIGWFCYSRAGYRESTPVDDERTLSAIAKELHETLAAAGAKPPYILVGHSLGGLYMRVFASLYPGEVAGLVLDDPGYERLNFDLRQIAPDLFDKLTFVPPSSPAILKAELAGADRIYAKGALDMDEPDLPLVILTGTLPPKDAPENLRSIFSRLGTAKLEAHAKLANARSQSRHFLCGRTSHSIHSDVPEMLIEAIDWVRKHANASYTHVP